MELNLVGNELKQKSLRDTEIEFKHKPLLYAAGSALNSHCYIVPCSEPLIAIEK